MRKLLSFLIALAGIVLGVCSPASAYGCKSFGQQGGTGCNSVIGGGTNPVVTFQSLGLATNASPSVLTGAGLVCGGVHQFVIVALGSSAVQNVTNVNVAPNVGASVNLTLATVDVAGRSAIYYGTPGTDAISATTATITMTMSSIDGAIEVGVYTAPIANLSSTTPVGSASNDATSVTSVSTTIATTSGGFVVAVGEGSSAGASTQTISGTESYTTDATSISGIEAVFGHANGIATNASSTVTYNNSVSMSLRMSAASWR